MNSPPFVSAHIFYDFLDAQPLLMECIDPLIQAFRHIMPDVECFFVRYWLGGPHIRLRVRTSPYLSEDYVRDRIRVSVQDFLKKRPSFFEVDLARSQEYMRRLYIAEYGKENFLQTYGSEGSIPLYPNNSLHFIPYEPEIGRYGGIDGVRLAEWHFDRSTTAVLTLLKTQNLHVRSVLLAHAAQLMLSMATAFIRDPSEVAAFLERYSAAWQRDFMLPDQDRLDIYKRAFNQQELQICHQIERVLNILDGPANERLHSVVQWHHHSLELIGQIRELHESSRLVFFDGLVPPDEGRNRLLVSFLHMTNNRLGVTIYDEAYLGYILSRGLRALERSLQ